MSRENVEAVRLAYEVAYVERSVEKVRDAYDEDYVFYTRPEWPGRNAYRTDEMPELWADVDQTYSDFSLAADDFEAIGDYVVVTVKQSARLRGSDARIDDTIYHVWHVLNGRPRETRGYSGRDEALEAVGLRE
ncbi:MAG: ester cyclase [Actinomycetota bacterium]|nr:ester cyclase [Actinomycetota bacterium]